MKNKASQNTRILGFLKSGRTLSKPQAKTTLRVASLTKRISELRQDGYNIVTTKNTVGNTAYRLS